MKSLLLFIITALWLSVAAVAQPLPPPMDPLDIGLIAQARAQGTVRVIVQFAPPAVAESAQRSEDTIRLFRLGLLANTRGASARLVANSETWAIPYAALEVDADALQAIAATPGVTAISLDEREYRHLESALPIINADDAHVFGESLGYHGLTGRGWTIVVLDDGIQASHPFFEGRIVDEACFSTNNPASNTISLCPNGQTSQFGAGAAYSMDRCGSTCYHGTHVMGIAIGDAPARRGAAPDATGVMINVFSKDNLGSFTNVSDQIAALQHVWTTLRHNYDIAAVNMSLGGGVFTTACDSDGNATQQARIDAINQLTGGDIAVVISAGNDSLRNGVSRPACISAAMTVSAIADDLTVASYSNVGPQVDFFAPGHNVLSSVPGSDYDLVDGTSMAAPFVSGAWAVLKQAVPGATVSEVRSALRQTGVLLDDNRAGGIETGIPLIQIDEALKVLTDQVDNGGFEARMAGVPDGWKTNGGARVKCNKPNKAFTPFDNCAALIRRNATGLGKLTFPNNAPDGPYDHALLNFGAHISAKNAVGGSVILKLVTTIPTKPKFKIPVAGTFDWSHHAVDTIELDAPLKKLSIVAKVKTGKFFLDEVYARMSEAIPAP